MAIDPLVKLLLELELFRGLRPLQITEIARRAHRVIYKPGETITAAATVGEGAVLIVSGEATSVAETGAPSSGAVPVGTLLAEMSMLIETEHAATIVAKTSVRALCITRSDMLEQMTEDQSLADHFVDRISTRLQLIAEELRAIDAALAESEASLDAGIPAQLSQVPAVRGTEVSVVH